MINKTEGKIIVFVKNPVLGKAKTRIAKTVGDEQALEIYKNLLEITKKQLAGLPHNISIYYSDYVEDNDLWSTLPSEKKIQEGTDLGQRLSNAMNAHFSTENDPLIIIGSDCPYLTKDLIESAFMKLQSSDVVIGPSKDGGYYLIGLSRPVNEVFQDIIWSTDQVLNQTIIKINSRSLNYSLIQELEDVDHFEDWEKYLLSTVKD